MAKALLLLPGVVLGVVPAALLWFSGGPRWVWGLEGGPHGIALGAAVLLGVYGLWMAARTMGLFWRVGRGTPAPWDPPEALVVEGPYRYVRNPMMSAVFALLGTETLVFGSWAVGAWMAFFIVGNAIYLPLFEEPGLEQRFGEAYREYRRNVPRWIPRLRPWSR